MKQEWHDLLFLHWAVPVEELQRRVPPELTLDLYEGQAYISIVPFRMSGVGLRAVPPLPGVSRFPELNVRTYVTVGGKPGVYFFSLDAASRLACYGARISYHLPYYFADMQVREGEGGWIDYHSTRRWRPSAELLCRYRPTGPEAPAQGLDDWLTARYCLYTVVKGKPRITEIHHADWQLAPAEAEIIRCTMTDPLGIRLPDTAPLMSFSRTLSVVIWPPWNAGE